MINNTAFNERFEGSYDALDARFLLNGVVLDGSFRGLTIHKGVGSGDEGFTVGTVFSSFVECSLYDLTTPIENQELQLQVGFSTDDIWITLGYFTATKVKKTAHTTSFTGLGRIASRLNVLFTQPATKTIAAIVSAIASGSGVTVDLQGIQGTSTAITANLSGYTCYEALQVIAAVTGAYATETADGHILLAKYGSGTSVAVGPDQMTSLPAFSENDYEILGAKVLVTEAGEDEEGGEIPEVSYTYGTPTLQIANPYMTEDLFEDSFIPNILGYTFRPAEIILSMGDPRLEASDILSVTDGEGETYTVPCHSIVHSYDGGISTTILSDAESDSDGEAASPRPITEQLERINSALVTAEQAIINRATITDLEAESARIDLLDATKAYVDTLIAGGITAASLSAANAYIAALLADNVTAANLSADKAYIDALTAAGITASSLTAANAYIADLVAASVTAQQIVADHGTISNLSSNYAQINFANVQTGTIQEAWIKSLMVQGHIIAQSGSVYYLDAIHINANYIDAGTLKADRILLEGDDGLYYQINLDRLGQATIEAMTAAEQAELKRTIHADAIMAHSITADHITVNNLQGTGGWINLANGTFEYRNNGASSWTNAANGIKWNGSVLEIRANQLLFTSGLNAESAINDAAEGAQNAQSAADLANSTLFGGTVDVVIDTSGSLGSDNITVDVDTFAEEVGGTYGTYEFVYTNGSWVLDETSVVLSSYGIAITGTPTEDDVILAMYGETIGLAATVSENAEAISDAIKNAGELGESLVSLSESLLSVVEQSDDNVLAINDLQGQTTSLSESINNSDARTSALEDGLETVENDSLALTEWMAQQKAENAVTEEAITALQTAVEALRLAIASSDGTIAWLRFGLDEQDNPVLSIGGGGDEDLEVAISNSEMQFKEAGNPISYISGKKMYITTAEITDELRFGDFAFIPRSNGNLSLKYVGENA